MIGMGGGGDKNMVFASKNFFHFRVIKIIRPPFPY